MAAVPLGSSFIWPSFMVTITLRNTWRGASHVSGGCNPQQGDPVGGSGCHISGKCPPFPGWLPWSRPVLVCSLLEIPSLASSALALPVSPLPPHCVKQKWNTQGRPRGGVGLGRVRSSHGYRLLGPRNLRMGICGAVGSAAHGSGPRVEPRTRLCVHLCTPHTDASPLFLSLQKQLVEDD